MDDVTYQSLEPKESLDLTEPQTFQAKFWGFGSDGTVGANKSAIKIIGDHTDKYAQGYFIMIRKIWRSDCLSSSFWRYADTFSVSCRACGPCCLSHQLTCSYDLVKGLKPGGILLNTLWSDEQLETHLPLKLKRYLAENNIRFYTINAMRLAQEVGLGRRINTAMETAFKLADIIPLMRCFRC